MSYNPLNLSPRQIEVAKLVSQDISSEDIAKKLGISDSDFKKQMRRVYY